MSWNVKKSLESFLKSILFPLTFSYSFKALCLLKQVISEKYLIQLYFILFIISDKSLTCLWNKCGHFLAPIGVYIIKKKTDLLTNTPIPYRQKVKVILIRNYLLRTILWPCSFSNMDVYLAASPIWMFTWLHIRTLFHSSQKPKRMHKTENKHIN